MSEQASEPPHDRELDALGLLCPLPVLRSARLLRSMQPGEVLKLVADDPAALPDVRSWCAKSGSELAATRQDGPRVTMWIRRGGSAQR